MTAAANTKFVAWQIVAAQTSATGTQFTITVTYSDATTTTITSTAASAQTAIGNAGGIELLTAGAHASLTACLAKDVTGLKVATAGTGTGTRSATISALQL